MEVLKIAPPFTYSYQCGSTLLVSYIPVYMYSVSMQLIANLAKLVIIFSFHPTPHSSWWRSFSGVCWPFSLPLTISTLFPKSTQVIDPYRIVSNTMNNVLLLLSFGLCSPALGCCLMLSITVNLCSWLMLVGRFLMLRLRSLVQNDPERPFGDSLGTDLGISSISPLTHSSSLDDQRPPSQSLCTDDFVNLLREQVAGVHRHLIECKWPVICTSCFFMTMFSWEIVGDEVGWLEAIWVPVLGVVILFIVMVWDALLVRGVVGPSPSLVPATRGTSLQSSSHSNYEFNRPKSSTETF
jgi:hypothetical protein